MGMDRQAHSVIALRGIGFKFTVRRGGGLARGMEEVATSDTYPQSGPEALPHLRHSGLSPGRLLSRTRTLASPCV